MLWKKLEGILVSLRFSLHQQILGISEKQACLPLGSLLYRTPRVCFMIIMRYCLLCKHYIAVILSETMNRRGASFSFAYYLVDHHLLGEISNAILSSCLFAVSESIWVLEGYWYVCIDPQGLHIICFTWMRVFQEMSYKGLCSTQFPLPQHTWCYIINKNKTHYAICMLLD